MKPSSYFRIGLFVLGALGILITGLLAFGAGRFFRPKLFLETYLDTSIQGIDIGSPVKFRGLTIGKVSNLEFTSNAYPQKSGKNTYIQVVMEIDRPLFPGMFKEKAHSTLNENIKKGLRVRPEPLGITGSSYLNLDYVNTPDHGHSPAINWKPRYTYIPSVPGQLTGLLDSVNKIMQDLETAGLQNIGKNLSSLLKNVDKTVEELEAQKLSKNIADLVAQLKHSTKEAKIEVLAEKASAFFQSSRALVKNLEKTFGGIPSTEIKETVTNVRMTSQNLQQVSQDLKKRPSLLLYGTPPSAKKKNKQPHFHFFKTDREFIPQNGAN